MCDHANLHFNLFLEEKKGMGLIFRVLPLFLLLFMGIVGVDGSGFLFKITSWSGP
jgi:hypothetical protein